MLRTIIIVAKADPATTFAVVASVAIITVAAVVRWVGA